MANSSLVGASGVLGASVSKGPEHKDPYPGFTTGQTGCYAPRSSCDVERTAKAAIRSIIAMLGNIPHSSFDDFLEIPSLIDDVFEEPIRHRPDLETNTPDVEDLPATSISAIKAEMDAKSVDQLETISGDFIIRPLSRVTCVCPFSCCTKYFLELVCITNLRLGTGDVRKSRPAENLTLIASPEKAASKARRPKIQRQVSILIDI